MNDSNLSLNPTLLNMSKEPSRFKVSDSEKLNDLMKLLEKNRSTLGPIYEEALEILTK